ncbi:MAG: MFS transporter [Myxococcota bacterium]
MSSRILLLTSLYLSQGLPFGFFTQALPVLLRQQGVSLEMIGMSSLLALPWALKFLWAPLVERLPSRRAAIVPLQALSAVVLVALAVADPERAVTWMVAAVFATNLLAATQDVATDGLAVDLLRPEERGLGNGVQVAGYRLGMVIGGGALLVVFEELGWTRSFGLMAALLLLASLPVALFREPPRAGRASEKVDYGALVDWLRTPHARAWLGVVAVYKFGDALGSAMVRPLLVDRGMSLADVGWAMGWLGSAAGLVGALAGGWLTGRMGRRAALVTFGVGQTVTIGAYALASAWPTRAMLYGASAAEHLFGGMATAALFTCMMDACRPSRAATDYTLQACVVVVSSGVAAAISGWSAGALGYTTHFVLSGAVSLLGVAAVGWRGAVPVLAAR